MVLVLVDKGAVLTLHFDATDEQDACIKRGFHTGAFIDVWMKAMASYPLWRTMGSLSISLSGSSASGK